MVLILITEDHHIIIKSFSPPSPAASCSHGDVVAFLVSIPTINKDLRDCDGTTPTEVTSDPNIRVLLQN